MRRSRVTVGLLTLLAFLTIGILPLAAEDEAASPVAEAKEPAAKQATAPPAPTTVNGMPAWRHAMLCNLEKPVTFNFTEIPLEDAVSFLSALSDVNMIVDPLAMIEDGEPVDRRVTLKVEKMSLRAAIGWILKLTDLRATIRDEAIFISTAARIAEKPVRRSYRVADLTMKVKDFPAPKMAVGMRIGKADNPVGGNPNWGNAPFIERDEEDETKTGKDLAEMIKETVAPESWKKDDGF